MGGGLRAEGEQGSVGLGASASAATGAREPLHRAQPHDLHPRTSWNWPWIAGWPPLPKPWRSGQTICNPCCAATRCSSAPCRLSLGLSIRRSIRKTVLQPWALSMHHTESLGYVQGGFDPHLLLRACTRHGPPCLQGACSQSRKAAHGCCCPRPLVVGVCVLRRGGLLCPCCSSFGCFSKAGRV
jgi:hypothetical protein